MARLSGLVAAILNEREIVVNLGTEQGIVIGMKFKVMDQAKPVKDPATGADLGIVRRDKVKVKVVDVQAKLSIARTYETYEVRTGGIDLGLSARMFSQLFESPKVVTRVRTLRYEDGGLGYTPLDETESCVKIGDPVELLEESGQEG